MAESNAQQNPEIPSTKTPTEVSPPLSEWKWLREWVGFGFGLIACIMSIYLFIQNQKLKSTNEDLEADKLAVEAWKLLMGDEDAIYSPSENSVALVEASQKVDAALKQNPKNRRATRLKAITLAARMKTEEAMAYAEKAVQLDPESFEAHLVHGNILSESGEHEKALKAYDRAAELSSVNNLAFANSGDLLRRLDRPDEAISKYRKAVEAKPDDFRSCNNLGYMLFKKGEIQEAIETFRECIRENPDNALLRFNLGNAFAGNGQMKEALEQYTRSLELEPNLLLKNTSLIPSGDDEVQISRDVAGNWKIVIGDQAVSFASNEIESLPTDEPGAAKSASLWRIDDDAI